VARSPDEPAARGLFSCAAASHLRGYPKPLMSASRPV
jgi:hypothetical protein